MIIPYQLITSNMSQHEKVHLQEAKVATYFGRKYDPKSLNTKTHIII